MVYCEECGQEMTDDEIKARSNKRVKLCTECVEDAKLEHQQEMDFESQQLGTYEW